VSSPVHDSLHDSHDNSTARRAREQRALADAVEQIGGVEMRPLGFISERYVHATIRLPLYQGQFRLKVVNPTRPDAAAIGDCCRVANLVHGGLTRLGRKTGFRVPEWRPVPTSLESRVYVVEEIEGAAIALDSKDSLAAVVDRLVALEFATRGFDPPAAKPDWIQSCNRDQYRKNLRSSLDGLHRRREITSGECDDVVARFNEHWTADPLNAGRCFSHGDLSLGNMREGGGEVWLIDFEHSHVGAPVLDVIHLCVNLLFDDRRDTARQLLQQYNALRATRGLPVLPGVSPALFLERAAGKWNAMKSPTAERRARMHSLLFQASELHSA
jgi:hypothetical protein